MGKAPARSKSAAKITFTVTAAEIDGIIAALPPDSEPKKLKMFRYILEDWFSLELPEHYRWGRSADAVALRQLKAIAAKSLAILTP